MNCLAFVAPLLVAYEVGTLFYSDRLLAQQHLSAVLKVFGAAAPLRLLPPVLVILVLLSWHIASKQKWHIDADAVAGAAVESVLWMAPLLALWLLGRPTSSTVSQVSAATVLTDIGTGIYEEFLFRLAAVGLIMLLLVDLLKVSKTPAAGVAIVVSSVLFSLYHFIGPDQFDWYRFAFRYLAGMYLAVIYVTRGFGIVVGAHACYNIIAAMM